MSLSVRLVLFPIAMVLASCASFETEFTSDPSCDWSEQKTFLWVPHDKDEIRRGAMIKTMIVEDLQAKGYQASQGDAAADFLVELTGGVVGTMETQVKTWDLRGPHDTQEAELVLVMIDGTTRDVLWRGRAKRRFPSDNPLEVEDELLRETIAALLAGFPPQAP